MSLKDTKPISRTEFWVWVIILNVIIPFTPLAKGPEIFDVSEAHWELGVIISTLILVGVLGSMTRSIPYHPVDCWCCDDE